MSQEDDQTEEVESSTIVMVDTCLDSDQEEEVVEEVQETEKDEMVENEENEVPSEQESLYCIVCNARFHVDQEEDLAEHLRQHELEKNEIESPSRRKVARRKASLAVKAKYESLIPSAKLSRDFKVKKEITRRAPKKKGQITLFKKEIFCDHCNKKLASQKALNSHLR